MGYGCRALELLQKYYEGKIPSLNEEEPDIQEEATKIDNQVLPILFYQDQCFRPKKLICVSLTQLHHLQPSALGLYFRLSNL